MMKDCGSRGSTGATEKQGDKPVSAHHLVSILPEDRAALAAIILEGLRPHLAALVQECMRPLLFDKEHWQREVLREEKPDIPAGARRKWTDEFYGRKCSTSSSKSQHSTTSSLTKRWARLKNMIQNSPIGETAICGVRSIGDARDSELLADVRTRRSSPRRPRRHNSPDSELLADIRTGCSSPRRPRYRNSPLTSSEVSSLQGEPSLAPVPFKHLHGDIKPRGSYASVASEEAQETKTPSLVWQPIPKSRSGGRTDADPTRLPSLRRHSTPTEDVGDPTGGAPRRGLARSCSLPSAKSDKDLHEASGLAVPFAPTVEQTPPELAFNLRSHGQTPMFDSAPDRMAALGSPRTKEQAPGTKARRRNYTLTGIFGQGMASRAARSEQTADERWQQPGGHLPSAVQEWGTPENGGGAQRHNPFMSVVTTSESTTLRILREAELLEFPPPSQSSGADNTSHALTKCKLRQVGSPLLLRLSGILRSVRLGVVHRFCMLLLAAGSVGICIKELAQAQTSFASPAYCPAGVCMQFQHLGDLALAVCSLLGLLAMGRLAGMKLLGRSTDLLVTYAMEHEVVWKWSTASLWQSVYLTVLWMSSVAFRILSIWPVASCWSTINLAVFALTSFIFMGLAFSILHVSCLICILIDSYAKKVREHRDLGWGVREWDKLSALLRKVSRAVHHGFLLVQTTAVAMLLCSFIHLVLVGGQIWWFISTVLLAQSLILIFFKAAEVTEMCTRVPSLINYLDFGDDDAFNLDRHYLVEHITYSDAGFYVGELRLTASMSLKLVYVSMAAAFAVLTKLTTT